MLFRMLHDFLESLVQIKPFQAFCLVGGQVALILFLGLVSDALHAAQRVNDIPWAVDALHAIQRLDARQVCGATNRESMLMWIARNFIIGFCTVEVVEAVYFFQGRLVMSAIFWAINHGRYASPPAVAVEVISVVGYMIRTALLQFLIIPTLLDIGAQAFELDMMQGQQTTFAWMMYCLRPVWTVLCLADLFSSIIEQSKRFCKLAPWSEIVEA